MNVWNYKKNIINHNKIKIFYYKNGKKNGLKKIKKRERERYREKESVPKKKRWRKKNTP